MIGTKPVTLEEYCHQMSNRVPLFEGPEYQIAEAVVRWVDDVMERQQWSMSRLTDQFCNRSPHDILSDGAIHYAAPCPDLSAVAAEALYINGLKPVLTFVPICRPILSNKFQCGVEVDLDDKTHTIGFSITSRRIEPGQYRENRSRPFVLREPWDGTTFHTPYLERFGIETPADLERVIPGYNHSRHMKTYRRTMSRRRYVGAIRKTMERIHNGERFLVKSAGCWQEAEAGTTLTRLGWTPTGDPWSPETWV